MAITSSDILKGIPEAYRSYFLVSSATLPEECRPTIEAFWEAIRVFAPSARLARPAQVIIATAPFRIPLGSGTLSFDPRPEVINAAIEHLVFLDVAKMASHAYQIKVACIVEEFVHALMNVSDEALTSTIVATLYRGVKLVNGQYVASGT